MANPTVTPSTLEKARKRLKRQYRHFGSWRKLAAHLSDQAGFVINMRYPYEFVVKGIVPTNREIQRVLGIHPRRLRTINDHMRNDLLQDMPAPLLAAALQYREVMA
jgi:hypothetical protein